jgi:hypothetical protein
VIITRFSRIGSPVAGITAVVYFGLVCLVAMCNPAMPTMAGSSEHTHHDQAAAHSPLCAWVCQATSSGELPEVASAEVFSLVTPTSIDWPLTVIDAPPSAVLHSRAPPAGFIG